MNTVLPRTGFVRTLYLLPMIFVPLLPAQRTASPAPATSPSGSEVVQLSAFEVQADSDRSYGALNSASITRFNVEMQNMPVSADIFTETFMRDVAATSIEDVIQGYSAGAGYAATAGFSRISTTPIPFRCRMWPTDRIRTTTSRRARAALVAKVV
jgi:hypothetical protein